MRGIEASLALALTPIDLTKPIKRVKHKSAALKKLPDSFNNWKLISEPYSNAHGVKVVKCKCMICNKTTRDFQISKIVSDPSDRCDSCSRKNRKRGQFGSGL